MENYKKLIDKMEKCCVLIRAFVCHLLIKAMNCHWSDNILVVSSGHIGDGLLKAHIIERIQERYKKVYLVCSPEEWIAFQMVLDISNIVCIQYNRKKEFGYSELKKIVANIMNNTRYDIIIALSERNSIWMTYPMLKIPARRKIMLFYNGTPERWYNKLKHKILKSTVDKDISCSCNVWKMDANKELIEALGLREVSKKIAQIPRQCDLEYSFDKYITITVDASISARKWELDKYIRLIKILLNTYDYYIVLLGSNISDYELEQYECVFEDTARVRNFIKRTDFKEFVELIRNGQFHIGVDSGSIHIAASVGTQAFCLTGKWDGNKIFPYKIEKTTEGTKNPICIFRRDVNVNNLTCYGCAHKGVYGWGNQKCYAQCRKGKACLCISQIQVEDVIATIGEYTNWNEIK